MLFINIDKPKPDEIKEWMKINNLNTNKASELLVISKRQFSRILSGESKAKRIHSLAMQMIWLLSLNTFLHYNYLVFFHIRHSNLKLFCKKY